MKKLKQLCWNHLQTPMMLSLVFILTVSLLFNRKSGEYFPYSTEIKTAFLSLTGGKEAILNLILGYSISKLEIYNKMGLMISPKTTFVISYS